MDVARGIVLFVVVVVVALLCVVVRRGGAVCIGVCVDVGVREWC